MHHRVALIRTFLIVGSFLTEVGAALAQKSANSNVDAIFADLTNPGSPGCALGVFRDGKIIYAKGYGLANVEDNIPITPRTVFDVGSVSKQFTAASIVLLERQGKLRLDDDIRKYVPELPDYSTEIGQKITILQLLNHTSGLRDYVTLFLLSGVNLDNVTTDDDALGTIVRQRSLVFPPGTDWHYTGSGYFLLSLVVKRISGKPLKDFASENIFQPLGLTHTQYRNDHTALIPHRALAYDPNKNGGYKLSVSYAEETGDGMVQSSIEDFQKWDENFYSGRVGGREFFREMEKSDTLNNGTKLTYAKGLFLAEYRGVRTIWHSGGSGGYRAYFLRFPEQHFSVACLCNRGDVNRAKRVHEVADLFLENLGPKQNSSSVNPTTEELRGLAGIYQDPKRKDVWRVQEKGGKLWIELDGSLLELRALGNNQFEPLEYPLEVPIKFEQAKETGHHKLVVDIGPQWTVTAEPIQAVKPSGADPDAEAGDYWSDDLKATYRLTAKDGKLWIKDLIGAGGISRKGTIPFDELRPLSHDEFDLKGAPIVIHFTRDEKHNVSGFTLNGFHDWGFVFTRVNPNPLED